MTKASEAVLDALAKPTGAVDNGSTLPRPRRRARKVVEKSSTVQIKRPAIHDWSCDSCGQQGLGVQSLLKHSRDKRHTTFRKEN